MSFIRATPKKTAARRGVPFYTRMEPRLRFFYPVFGAMFLFLAFGLFWRQIIEAHYYKDEQLRQSLRRILLPGTRGNIYDRHGVLLVGNRPVFSAVIYLSELRKELRDRYNQNLKIAKSKGGEINRIKIRQESRAEVLQEYQDILNAILGTQYAIDPTALDRHFSQRFLMPYPLAKDLKQNDYARLLESLPPDSLVQIQVDSARYYPYGAAAAHALGYVGSTLDLSEEGVPGAGLRTFTVRGKIGKAGLEKSLDSRLQGFSGAEIWQVDPSGLHGKLIEKKFPSQGESVMTSLDINLQCVAEEALGERRGAIVVIEVGTREVLTIASHPSYDLRELTPYITPAVYDRINEEGGWLNRALQGLYPPGSPFKVITASAALRSGKIDVKNTFVNCTGYHRVGTRLFPCMKRSGHGDLDLVKALSVSCNPYFYSAALGIGAEALAAEARLYGLANPTGIQLPYETRRMCVPTPAWKKANGYGSWTGGDTANMAIGQGYLLTTPLQMALVAEQIASGRFETSPPSMLHDPLAPRGKTIIPLTPLGLNRAEYDGIVAGMELASETGTSKRAHLEGIRIAAKTGTAQTYVHGKERDLAWWVGFVPIDDPKIAIAIMVEEISDTDHFGGGRTASPIAKEIISAYFEEKG
jgi:penicillin-binding protein 2